MHDREVENSALAAADELIALPRDPGVDDDTLITSVKEAIGSLPEGLPAETATSVLAELNAPRTMQISFNGRSYKKVLAAVWNTALKHTHTSDICRRLAEEIFDGIGKCHGGKLGRLLNCLRGYVNIGLQAAETGACNFASEDKYLLDDI